MNQQETTRYFCLTHAAAIDQDLWCAVGLQGSQAHHRIGPRILFMRGVFGALPFAAALDRCSERAAFTAVLVILLRHTSVNPDVGHRWIVSAQCLF